MLSVDQRLMKPLYILQSESDCSQRVLCVLPQRRNHQKMALVMVKRYFFYIEYVKICHYMVLVRMKALVMNKLCLLCWLSAYLLFCLVKTLLNLPNLMEMEKLKKCDLSGKYFYHNARPN